MRTTGNGPSDPHVRGARRRRRALLATAVAVALVSSPRAQATASPCTGTVRDVGGAPLVGARVTFVQEWSQTFGRAMHRAEVATDADGRFTATLHPGSPYMAWAIGPAKAAGERLVSATTMRAGAGRTVDFVAHLPRSPRKLKLLGVDPWVDVAPPSLRLLVGGTYALGRDVPLPGDGTVTVEPWPDDDVDAALVDARGAVIERKVLEEKTAVVEFSPTRTFTAVVAGAAGAPVAGASLHVRVARDTWVFPRDPMPGLWQVGWREAGITDANGRAAVRVPWPVPVDNTHLIVVATHCDHAAAIAGCLGGHFHEDGAAANDDDELAFVLDQRAPARWQIDGLEAADRPWVEFATHHACRMEQIMTVGDLWWPAATDATGATAPLLAIGKNVHGLIRLPATGAVPPRRFVAHSLGTVSDLRRLELTTARDHRLQFVTPDGRPAPFVDVAITIAAASHSVRWHDRATTDGEGRLRLLCERHAWQVVAASSDGFACHVLATDSAGGDERIVLQPFRLVATLHVRDADGRPVAGARTQIARRAQPVQRSDDPWPFELASPLLRAARSDATGTVRVPLPAGALQGVEWRDARGRRSEPMTVQPNDTPTLVTLR